MLATSQPRPLRETAPLLDAYLSYFEKPSTPFTIPGHKQRASGIDAGLGAVVDCDTPLYGGLDEIKLTRGTLRRAEALAAQLWGADVARFSTGGSTHANQAIILALGKPGDRVAVSRTAHRSVLSGLVLAGLEPVWLAPDICERTGVPTGISVDEFRRTIEAAGAPPPIALLVTEPGYLGTLSDLQPLAAEAHSRGIPVIVDAAWGGHFGFHPGLPAHCLSLGADALITSVHKALPGVSGSALLLARGGRLSLARVEAAFETTHTTSPAGAPLASIDAVRALLSCKRGGALLGALLVRVAAFKAKVGAAFAPLRIFLGPEDFGSEGSGADSPARFDPAKLVLRASQLGASGVDIECALLGEGIRVEMADRDTVVFLATLADGDAEFSRLADALVPILERLRGPARPVAAALTWSISPERGASMREAFFADTEMVAAGDATGRVSADLIAPYPPGVAVVAPGEVLTARIIAGLAAYRSAGVRIAYATDSTLASYRVVVGLPKPPLTSAVAVD